MIENRVSQFDTQNDNITDWFSGSPEWIKRS